MKDKGCWTVMFWLAIGIAAIMGLVFLIWYIVPYWDVPLKDVPLGRLLVGLFLVVGARQLESRWNR